MKETLFVRRSVRECMGAAWTLMGTNIARVARALWMPAAVLALTSALLAVLIAFNRNMQGGWLTILWMFLASLAVVLASITLDAGIFRLVNERTMGFCFARAVKAFGVNLAIILVATVILWALAASDFQLSASGTLQPPSAALLFFAEMLVFIAAMLIFLSPMIFALTKFMVEPQTKLKQLWHDYRKGLRSAGFIIAFYLLCAIVLIISYLVIASPMVIASSAAAVSAAGVVLGDEAGLPGYFLALYAATVFVTSYVAIVLRIWSLFAAYYMYASIEARNGRTDEA
ncbi:MAG: hypothetical protein LUI08_07625 [Prevotella sp.]|nr:hypothetical protein [Prevotella sp.]